MIDGRQEIELFNVGKEKVDYGRATMKSLAEVFVIIVVTG